MTDNIIEFPKVNTNVESLTKEQLRSVLDEYKEEVANEMSEFLFRHVIGELTRVGHSFDKNMEHFMPSMMMVLESIRSLALQAHGIEHDFQSIAKDILEIETKDINSFKEKMVDIEEELD